MNPHRTDRDATHPLDRWDIAAIIGVALIAAGVASWSIPAASIVTGAAIAVAAVLAARDPDSLARSPD